MNPEKPSLIHGDALKASAGQFVGWMRTKIENEQKGFFSIFDKWFTHVVMRLNGFDPLRPWEDSVREETARGPQNAGLEWDLLRLRQFLDRWSQGRFVDYAQREKSQIHYHNRYGTEFGSDVLLTCQGAPRLMQWRGMPLMKTVFDFAVYSLLLWEIKPRTIFEIGSGAGASAIWLADQMALLGLQGHVHSVDIAPVALEHAGVTFTQGDCNHPGKLFDAELLKSAPHPWLVIEDAHHNVEAVLDHFHKLLQPGDYLVVEDSEVKREDLRRFTAAHPGCYKVDTQFTDYFGRNATCAGDSIFVRTKEQEHAS